MMHLLCISFLASLTYFPNNTGSVSWLDSENTTTLEIDRLTSLAEIGCTQCGLEAFSLAYKNMVVMPEKYEKCLARLKELVKVGNRRAEYLYGIVLFFGKGVEADLSLSRILIERAAMKGDPDAQYFMAKVYLYNDIYEKSIVGADFSTISYKRLEYLEHAVKQNHTKAMVVLGKEYLKDRASSMKGLLLLIRAADAGEPEAVTALNDYELGR